ncbi:unnamed protein product, partial [Musa hybrid cultivar]
MNVFCLLPPDNQKGAMRPQLHTFLPRKNNIKVATKSSNLEAV